MMNLNGKTAIVCGGSAGVGRATVDALVAQGCRVGVIARGEERLAELEREFGTIVDVGPRVVAASADVADAAELEMAVGNLVERLGPPQVWVNCAMLTAFSPFREMGEDEFKRIVDVTFIGQVNGCRAALTHMKDGTIVNVGSGLSYRSVPLQSAYCAAKHAINGFSASLRSELIAEESDVQISLVQLPALNTPQFDWAKNRMEEQPQPAPPIYASEVAADAIVRAARTAPRELLVGKSVLQLTAGQAIIPDWMDRQMADSGPKLQKSGRPAEGSAPGNLWKPGYYASTPDGSYTDRARSDGMIVDADAVRLAGAFTVGAVGMMIGLALAAPLGAMRGR